MKNGQSSEEKEKGKGKSLLGALKEFRDKFDRADKRMATIEGEIKQIKGDIGEIKKEIKEIKKKL